MAIDKLIIKGAREHNLKNINVEIPKNKLVIITGVSGSGKSSLAFSTIYAEGQRRYLDSLSSYARQFLGNSHKPSVDSIEGLSPSIAIDQKSTSHNPRSTVGTVTEIYDYFRLLFARIGMPYCINGHGVIKTQTLKQIVDAILSFDQGDKIQILSPINIDNKLNVNDIIEGLRKDGFLRIVIDNEVFNLDEEIKINKNIKNLELVIDRIILNKDAQTKSRLNSSVELALNKSNGLLKVLRNDNEYLFNESYSCNKCNYSIKNLEPSLFSFNSPLGACEYCNGLGFTYEPDELKMIPDPELSIAEGAIDFFKNTGFTNNLDWQRFYHIIKHYNIDINKPFKSLDKKEINYLLYGSQIPIQITLVSANNRKYEHYEIVEGVCELISRRHQETSSESAREYYSKYMSEKVCKFCKGRKLNKLALSVLINDKNIFEITDMNINETIEFFLKLELNDEQKKISDLLLKEIISRLSFLSDVGLEYLTLSRTANTLSGGEAQRIRLASQIGSNLTGVLYVLDEPSIGLHQRDNEKLISTLYKMRDLGNTLIVVEHDEDTMRASDYIIDIGPGAGVHGGNVVASGTIDEIINNKDSLTGQYLSKTMKIEIPKHRRKGNGNKLVLKGAKGNNLKNITVEFPLNKLICVTGVSGSGKSTLIMETLVKGIQKQNFNPFIKPLEYKELTGTHNIDKLVEVTQDPIGRTPRSNPATYIGVFDEIRELFANLKESKEKGFTKARFSFNVKGGRCEKCQGDGEIKIDMHFLPTVYVTCDDCKGYKYNEETLSIRYKTKNIYDVLKMPAEEALKFFESFPSIHRKLQLLVDVGLGYIELGASSKHLSGGEAQRIKLTKFLQRKPTGKTLYVLDEPTTGLHIDDIDKLIKIFNRIVDGGDTVLIIEHNLDIIKVSDYIIDIGPEGGNLGGNLVCAGTPEFILNNKQSYTAKFLKKILEESN